MAGSTLQHPKNQLLSRFSALVSDSSNQYVWLILLFAFAVLAARVPRLLWEGHINAEEGTTYLRYAWDATPLRAFLAPHQGYWSLLDNVVTLAAARILPLSAAALLFSWSALTIWLAVTYLILSCEVFATPLVKFVAVAAFLFTAPSVEVWLILEMCHFALAVGAAIILISDEHRHRAYRLSLLLLAGLSSVPACFLLPLFCLRAFLAKSRDRWIQASLLGLATVLQTSLVLRSMLAGARGMNHPYRFLGFVLLQRAVVAQFLPAKAVLILNDFVHRHLTAALLGVFWILAIVMIAFVVNALRGRPAALWLLAAALIIGGLDWYGCGTCGADLLEHPSIFDSRYFFPMSVLLNLALVTTVFQKVSGEWGIVRRSAGLLILFALVSGLFQYRRNNAYLSVYPSWQPQVIAWSKDPSRAIVVGPDFWIDHPLYLSPNHENYPGLPFNAYDSSLVVRTPR